MKLKPKIKPRILTFSVTPDQSSQYIPIMNAILAAQRLVSRLHLPSFQQLTVRTEHHHRQLHTDRRRFIFFATSIALDEWNLLATKAPRGIVTVFTRTYSFICQSVTNCAQSTYITDTYSRAFVPLPRLFEVDYRASCFCHKKVLDQGYVCSVCLSSKASVTTYYKLLMMS